MNPLLSPTLVECLGWTLVHFLWQGLAIAALLAVFLRVARHFPAYLRYSANCLALLLLALAPVMTFQYIAAQNPAPLIAEVEPAPALEPAVESVALDANPKPKLVVTARHAAQSLNFTQRLELLFPWLVLGWSLGVFALSCRLLGGWLQIQRLKRNTTGETLDKIWHDKLKELAQRLGVTHPVRLLQSALVEVPTVIGWLRPIILLPASCVAGLTPAQLEAILAHELAHIRRHDYLVNLLQSVVETVLFYHPAVWWVSRQVRAERENCCDDLAVEVCGDRLEYARALATLEELRLAPALALAAAGPPLLPRIRRLAGQTAATANRPAWPMAGVITLVMIAALAIGLRGNRADAKDETSPQHHAIPDVPKLQAQTESNRAPQRQVDEIVDANRVTPDTNVISKPKLYAQAKPVHTGVGRGAILSKLDTIRVDSIAFDHTPLPEVISKLAEIAKAGDPDKQGINFYFDRGDAIGRGVVIPGNLRDLDQITVTIMPPLKNLWLADVLDLIARTADYPITYSFLDYAIVVRAKSPDEFMETRTFHVDPNAFQQGLQGVTGTSFGNASNGGNGNGSAQGTRAVVPRVDVNTGLDGVTTGAGTPRGRGPSSTSATENSTNLNLQLRQFFAAAGADFDTNHNPANASKTFAWKDRRGTLLVRSTPQDLDAIQTAIDKINAAAPQNDTTNGSQWEQRVFHVDPDTISPYFDFGYFNRNIFSGNVFLETNLPSPYHVTKANAEAHVHNFLTAIGIDLVPDDLRITGKMFVWDNRANTLSVRSSRRDMDLIAGALQALKNPHLPNGDVIVWVWNTEKDALIYGPTNRQFIQFEFGGKDPNDGQPWPSDPPRTNHPGALQKGAASNDSSFEQRSFHIDSSKYRRGLESLELAVQGTNDIFTIGKAPDPVDLPPSLFPNGFDFSSLAYKNRTTKTMEQLARDFVAALGVNTDKISAWDDRAETLSVRSTKKDLDLIGTALQALKNPDGEAGRVFWDKKEDRSITFHRVKASILYGSGDYDSPGTLEQLAEKNSPTAKAERALATRTFRVDPNTFIIGLEKITGMSASAASPATASSNGSRSIAIRTNNADSVQALFQKYFSSLGVDFNTNNPANLGKAFVWNSRKGVLMVRATAREVDLVEASVAKLNQSTPEINIKTQFVEMDASKSNFTGGQIITTEISSLLDLTNLPPSGAPPLRLADVTNALSRVTNAIIAQSTGILTYPQYKKLMDALERQDGTDVLKAPEVTTESGRQCQVQALTMQTIATGLKTTHDKDGKVNDDYQTQTLPFGPTLDVIPFASADGRSVDLVIVVMVSEFLGYDDPKHAPKDAPKAALDSKGVMPLPRFRMRRLMTQVSVKDANTLVLSGVEAERVVTHKDKVPLLGDLPLLGRLFRSTSTTKTRKNLLVFITPTLINPNGTRYNPDDEAEK